VAFDALVLIIDPNLIEAKLCLVGRESRQRARADYDIALERRVAPPVEELDALGQSVA
jgi:hypothetical protein